MTGTELAAAAIAAATQHKTLYVKGCFGAPLTAANKARWKQAYAYNRRADRAAKIDAADEKTFGFDCVCFLKALLWGWQADPEQVYGGASYASGGVPDIGEDQVIRLCAGVSEDLRAPEVGEVVWLPGHMGIYVGDGLVAEATPSWADGVQLTACNRELPGYKRRDWKKHGKLPWVTYATPELPTLRQGARSECVRAMQLLLLGRGEQLPRYGADGDFGAETFQALRRWQAGQGLAADGICGQQTWYMLLGVKT